MAESHARPEWDSGDKFGCGPGRAEDIYVDDHAEGQARLVDPAVSAGLPRSKSQPPEPPPSTGINYAELITRQGDGGNRKEGGGGRKLHQDNRQDRDKEE